MVRCLAAVGALVLLVPLGSRPALAQVPTQQKDQTVVPPRRLPAADVTYPAGADGDASVLLELTIGAEGEVKASRVVDGVEPFASTAERASLTWHFEPALRNGKPVASRIRFAVTFTAPLPPEPDPSQTPAPASQPETGPASSPAPKPPQAQAKPPPKPAIEVTIYGHKPAPGAVSMGRAEVRQLPGAFGDPFRAIEAMPGVTPIVSGLPFFYVRGAPPGNVGYFFDGVRVPYLYHVGLGPSVIHPGLVDRVDLYPGGYPAQFGRYAGGIVAAESTQPRTDLHGEGNIRLFDAGVLVESGFANGRGTALVAGRYSYTAAIISLIAKDVTLDYRDYEARASYDLTPKDRISLFTFGAYDLLTQTTAGVKDVLFGSEFYRMDTRYDHQFGPASTIRAAVTLGWDQTKVPGQPRRQQDTMLGGRVEAKHALSDVTTLRGGADIVSEALRADVRPYSDPEDPTTVRFNNLFPPRNDLSAGTWTDLVVKLPGVEITPGLRVDLFRSGGASAVGVDPRISSRIRLADRVHMLHALGIAHQPPSFLIPVPGLAIGNLSGGLQRSIQSSAGVEVELPEATTATLTAFDNIFLNMSDSLGVRQSEHGSGLLEDNRSLGSAIGLELFVRRRLTRNLGGFIAYTLSRSTRSVDRQHFPSAFDRRHVFNAALAYNLGRNWRAGSRLTIYSGIPSYPESNGLVAPPRQDDPPRDPTFYRLDLRLEKRWTYGKSTWLAFVAEFLNATLHKEVLMGREIGPVTIPSVGLEGGF